MEMKDIIYRRMGISPHIVFQCRICKQKKRFASAPTWKIPDTEFTTTQPTALAMLSILLSGSTVEKVHFHKVAVTSLAKYTSFLYWIKYYFKIFLL